VSSRLVKSVLINGVLLSLVHTGDYSRRLRKRRQNLIVAVVDEARSFAVAYRSVASSKHVQRYTRANVTTKQNKSE